MFGIKTRILKFVRSALEPPPSKFTDPAYNLAYQRFSSYADPLYAPWLVDAAFLKIDSQYPDCALNYFKDGRYLQYMLARQAAHLDIKGDFIECGVFQGKSLDIFAWVLDDFNPHERAIFGFDSFKGLDQPNDHDRDARTNKQFFAQGMIQGWDKETIQAHLSHHRTPIDLIQGWIPQSFAGYEEKRFVFAHVDVDLYQATFDTLAFIYPRMMKGGIILFDDYGFPMCAGVRKAVDDYLADKTEKAIPVPSGQAFMIKY